jgi:hypothetical protein
MASGRGIVVPHGASDLPLLATILDTWAHVNEHKSGVSMKILSLVLANLVLGILLCSSCRQPAAQPSGATQANNVAPAAWPANLPIYDHIVVVIEENKDYKQIADNPAAPYINGTLRAQGASFTQMYAEEHHSEGNYFWLFSGSNQGVKYEDAVPSKCFNSSSLGEQLIRAGRSFKSYSEDLPAIGFSDKKQGLYSRKHVPWISFCNIPNGTAVADSSNLRFKEDFPTDYNLLPTVAFVIPNLIDDMHNGSIPASITAGDTWLHDRLDGYYQWAKEHNSLLIVTFDESDDKPLFGGPTDPAEKNPDKRNQIATIFAGAHVKHGDFSEVRGITHVNVLRTMEAMYKLNPSGAQADLALKAGIADDYVITDVFDAGP